jgi:hypothetical protein
MTSRIVIALFALPFLLVPAPTLAQPPAKANPQAPTLAPVVPLGMQRGTTLELTLTGTNLADPTGLWTSFPAKVTIPTDAKNGTLPTSLRVKLEVAKDAPLGFHSIRLATKRGMSNLRLFCNDDLPQVMKAANNRELKTAQMLPVPCVVVGRADAEATDYFKISVKANQRISFEILGRRLGSAFDPEITLLDAMGQELPGGFANDSPGLQTDARLTYTSKKEGDVFIAVRDTSYRGGADFHYRLRIGDFPCATTPLPLAAKRGSKVQVRFTGPTVDGVAPVEVQVPADPTVTALQVAPRGANGLHGWPVMLAVSDLDEQLEKEPNNDPAKANRIAVPGAITARFEEKNDLDHFVFAAKKGKRYIIEAHTIEHNSPTEVDMVLKNDKGTQLLASDEKLPTAKLDFTAPADGDFTLVVKHLHSWGGPDEVYRVTVTPYEPGFALTLNIDRWDVAPGGTVSIPIFVARSGYNGAIEVSLLGPKGISGTLTIPAGPKPPNVPSGVLVVKADELSPGPLTFHIQGKATIDGKAVVELASMRNLLKVSMANLPVPPQTMYHTLGLAVTEKPPFAVAATFDTPSAQPGKPITATLTITRQPGFTGDVTVTLIGLPPGIAAPPVKIPGAMNTAKATLTLQPNVKVGQSMITFQGAAKHNSRDYVARSAPVALVVKK